MIDIIKRGFGASQAHERIFSTFPVGVSEASRMYCEFRYKKASLLVRKEALIAYPRTILKLTMFGVHNLDCAKLRVLVFHAVLVMPLFVAVTLLTNILLSQVPKRSKH